MASTLLSATGMDNGRQIRWQDVWTLPLPALDRPLDRWIARLAGSLAVRQVRGLDALRHLAPAADPFILAMNHGSRRETVYLTALLLLARGGQPVHFLADWNFRLIPGVGYLYDRSGAITVWRKPARPAVLNRFKPTWTSDASSYELARERLASGASIALFPEGTINRRADRLLRPRSGTARLAIATGTPVIPLGIRFLGTRAGGRLLDSASPIELSVGPPLVPPAESERGALSAFRAEIMAALGERCGKSPPAVSAPPPGPRTPTADHVLIHDRGQPTC